MKTVRGSWQENERSLKILARKWKILEDLDKNFEDPWRSWQENEISLKILTRILKIFKGSHKDLLGSLKILQRFSSGMCHNRAKNIESARRIGTFFRCFGSHFRNLARHFKVGNLNVIYYRVHVNTLVIKSAVHCLQLCTIIMIICETLFDHFRLSTSLSTWYNFTPGLYFLLPLEAIIIYTIFTSYRSRHVVFCNHTFGHAP